MWDHISSTPMVLQLNYQSHLNMPNAHTSRQLPVPNSCIAHAIIQTATITQTTTTQTTTTQTTTINQTTFLNIAQLVAISPFNCTKTCKISPPE
jgi:hypothetical protein